MSRAAAAASHRLVLGPSTSAPMPDAEIRRVQHATSEFAGRSVVTWHRRLVWGYSAGPPWGIWLAVLWPITRPTSRRLAVALSLMKPPAFGNVVGVGCLLLLCLGSRGNARHGQYRDGNRGPQKETEPHSVFARVGHERSTGDPSFRKWALR